MIYQRLAKVFLICSGGLLSVVPANAGTHSHRRQSYGEVMPTVSAETHHVDSPAAGRERSTSAPPTTCGQGWSHRSGRGSEFIKKYGVYRLVHVETFASPQEAIAREKQLKNWHRDWKTRLIEEDNPDWSDLSHLL
jgi:putative endonuclease